MTEEETVYADWSALRVAVPVAALALVLAVGGFVTYRLLAPEPELASVGVDEDQTASSVARPSLPPQQAAEVVMQDFLERLEAGRFDGLTFAFTEFAAAQQEYEAITGSLGGFQIQTQPGPLSIIDSANARVPLTIDWTLEDGVQFATTGELDLVLVGVDWQVDWEPSIVESTLDPGDSLVRERVTAPRAPILGRNGFALVDNRPLTTVGVIPRQVDDLAALSQALGQLLAIDPGDIQARIAPAPSDSRVAIASGRPEALTSIRGQLSALPGVVLEDVPFPLTPDDRFGRALLGRAAEVTAEILAESPDVFIAGDVAGRSGLQREYNLQLTGIPGFQIRVKRRFPSSTATPTPATTAPAEQQEGAEGVAPVEQPLDPDVVYLSAPVPGTPLNLTIDSQVQTAAENALAQTELPSALVAIEVSTGQILAVANGPGAAVNNFAMTGQYPPGSIFKTITAYAALEKGLSLNDPVDCPFSLNVNGREFSNAEGEVLGVVPLRRAYVLSCNTAFINLAGVLDPSDFPNTAARFGIGPAYSLGTASFAGNVPTPGGPVDKAATSFGQSRVLFSPLSAAVMAATAAGGTYRPPTLVIDPEAPAVVDQPLNPGPAGAVQEIMRAVVTNGTGRAVAGVAGGPVSGKTGTAEFGDQVPPQAHAWFVGFQGDLAFAVFVEGGEFGGATAAPIAGSFLNQLPR